MEQKTTSHLNGKVHFCFLEFKLTATDFKEVQGHRALAQKFNLGVKRICKGKQVKVNIAEKRTLSTRNNGKKISRGRMQSK